MYCGAHFTKSASMVFAGLLVAVLAAPASAAVLTFSTTGGTNPWDLSTPDWNAGALAWSDTSAYGTNTAVFQGTAASQPQQKPQHRPACNSRFRPAVIRSPARTR